MISPTRPGATGIPRRAFLVRSAVFSAGAVLSTARAGEPGSWATPQLARLIPEEPTAPGIARSRCVRAGSGGVVLDASPCRLRVTPLSLPLRSIEASADLDVFYPTPALWTTAWTVAPAPIRPVSGEPHAVAAGVESLAPAASGTVRLRLARRPIGGVALAAHELRLPSRPGAYLLAIPLTRAARLPAWRRCDATEIGPEPLSLRDPWRDDTAAPGCVVVRLDLIPVQSGVPAHPPVPVQSTTLSLEGAD